uniref:DEK_C domain-containing protein n=1 Tax=Heterorhabditis bacteriophora TaxID=37862 RepID=A0A1I7WQ63_HETBA
MLRVPLKGEIYAQMTGLISEIAMQHDVDVHHCVAQIRDLRLTLKGSMAADVLQWFRTTLTRAIRRKLEEEYCRVMKLDWLPWVEAQLSQFPINLTISDKPKVNLKNDKLEKECRRWTRKERKRTTGTTIQVLLVQSLQSIAMTQQYIDLRMRSDLMWNGAFVESAPVKIPLWRISVYLMLNYDFIFSRNILSFHSNGGHVRKRTHCTEYSGSSPLCWSSEVFSAPKVENISGSILFINVETEFILTMEMRNRKTIDFLVHMSTPFFGRCH